MPRKKQWKLKRAELEIKPSILARFLRVPGSTIKQYAELLGIRLRKSRASSTYRWLTRLEASDIMKLHYARRGGGLPRGRSGQSGSSRAV